MDNQIEGVEHISVTDQSQEEVLTALRESAEIAVASGEYRTDDGEVIGHFAEALQSGRPVVHCDGDTAAEAMATLAAELMMRLYQMEMQAQQLANAAGKLKQRLNAGLSVPPHVKEEQTGKPNLFAVPVHKSKDDTPPEARGGTLLT